MTTRERRRLDELKALVRRNEHVEFNELIPLIYKEIDEELEAGIKVGTLTEDQEKCLTEEQRKRYLRQKGFSRLERVHRP